MEKYKKIKRKLIEYKYGKKNRYTKMKNQSINKSKDSERKENGNKKNHK